MLTIKSLAIAGLLGRTMLENFEISLPVLAMTGGIILFLVALRTVLHQSSSLSDQTTEQGQPPDLRLALTPLAFRIRTSIRQSDWQVSISSDCDVGRDVLSLGLREYYGRMILSREPNVQRNGGHTRGRGNPLEARRSPMGD
ncbi:MarC family protein [Sinorhizobium meliloti]|uniref:MarC family protein n=1 Tax=Rhizobium meliloti TaxID=382 RepID=UPI001F184408|nr:MarC family protein [Sinorhizobium meliloti]